MKKDQQTYLNELIVAQSKEMELIAADITLTFFVVALNTYVIQNADIISRYHSNEFILLFDFLMFVLLGQDFKNHVLNRSNINDQIISISQDHESNEI